MLANYFKIAWLNLLQQKLYGLIDVGCLSIATSASRC